MVSLRGVRGTAAAPELMDSYRVNHWVIDIFCSPARLMAPTSLQRFPAIRISGMAHLSLSSSSGGPWDSLAWIDYDSAT